MRLVVTTPTTVAVDVAGVGHVRAEDATGAFGIRPGHADFLTVLAISVLTWREDSGRERHVAVRGGVLRVRDGDRVEVATREAVGAETLERLGDAVLERFEAEARAEGVSRISAARLHVAALRALERLAEAERGRPVRSRPGVPVEADHEPPPGEGRS